MTRLLYLHQADPTPFLKCFDQSKLYYDADNIGKDDVIYFGGGTDVNPSLYGEDRHFQSSFPDYFRDNLEQEIFKRWQGRVKGFLGICRGSQFLTVMNGGKLIQHIGSHHLVNHMIQTDEREHIEVTSTHHQMMFPFNLPKRDYKIIATSVERLSNMYCRGGWLPRYTAEDVPVEPEIVWYPMTRTLCIQGHPEYMLVNEKFPQYCRNLIRERLLSQ